MSRRWAVQDARSRFGEFLDTALADGPQILTRRGVEAAVLVPMEHWLRLERLRRSDLKELLLTPGPRTDDLAPPRRR